MSSKGYMEYLPAYKTWQPSLQLFWRYDCGRWN